MQQDLQTPSCRVAAVIPAAGCGQRMGNPIPKQYLQVCGRPLISHCLKALQEVPWMDRIVLVADDVERMAEVVGRERFSKVVITKGTGSRHRSIWTGVEELSGPLQPDVVVVHDGVRPLVPLQVLTQVVNAAAEHGAAGAVRPLVSTVVKPDGDGILEESLVRSQFRNSEMPQAFKYEVLRNAYRRCSSDDLDHGTECLALALKYSGVRAKLVPGPAQLWKVTDEKDLAVARMILPKYTRRIAVVCQTLNSSLEDRCLKAGASRECSDSFESNTLGNTTDTDPKHTEAEVSGYISKGCLDFSKSNTHSAITRHAATEVSGPSTDGIERFMSCDSHCLRVFEKLRTTLETHSLKVVISRNISGLQESVCSLVVISKFTSQESFRNLISSLVQQMNEHLVSLILVLTLKSSVDFPSLDVFGLQQALADVSRDIPAKLTVVLIKITGDISKKNTSPDDSDIATSTENTDTVQGASEERSSGMSRNEIREAEPAPDVRECEVPQKKKMTSVDYEARDEINSGGSKLQDMIIAILDQPTGCFNGQIILIEDELGN